MPSWFIGGEHPEVAPWYSYAGEIKKVAERSDVVTEIAFEYQGTAYKMTVPAGIDYTAILADDERFYGYFYFAQLIGATIETR